VPSILSRSALKLSADLGDCVVSRYGLALIPTSGEAPRAPVRRRRHLRLYGMHWTAPSLPTSSWTMSDAAVERGCRRGRQARSARQGRSLTERIASWPTLRHGFCLLQFNDKGYDPSSLDSNNLMCDLRVPTA